MEPLIKKSLCLLLAVSLFSLVCGVLLAQEVAVYNDKSPAWIDPVLMVASIDKVFPKFGVPYKVVKAPELETYMKANATGIVIIATGIAPGEIFKNQGNKDLVHTWLFDGGTLFWTGDWPFYYWDAPANCPGTAGETSVFGNIITGSAASVKLDPTDKGKQLIPSIKQHTANRPILLATLKSNDYEYESYAEDGTNADPISLRAPKMKGWFVNMHTWPENETTDEIATQMAELLKNKFLAKKIAVSEMGKLTSTWGNIKRG
jgi:hypothetical protein